MNDHDDKYFVITTDYNENVVMCWNAPRLEAELALQLKRGKEQGIPFMSLPKLHEAPYIDSWPDRSMLIIKGSVCIPQQISQHVKRYLVEK